MAKQQWMVSFRASSTTCFGTDYNGKDPERSEPADYVTLIDEHPAKWAAKMRAVDYKPLPRPKTGLVTVDHLECIYAMIEVPAGTLTRLQEEHLS